MELEYLCVLWFSYFLIDINSCLTWTGIDMYWESLVCCVKCKRLIINISRFVCFTFHVTKKTIPWMRTNSSTLLFSGWMYVQIQWLNETLLIMNKTLSSTIWQTGKNAIHILSVFWCFSLVMNDGRTRDDCEFLIEKK